MYAHHPDRIVADSTNAYKTTYRVLDDNSIHFTTVRDLETAPWNFAIPLDETIPMVSAYSDSTHELSKVHESAFPWEMTLFSNGYSKSGKTMGMPGVGSFGQGLGVTAHGLIMWVAWTVLGLFQIITNRYLVDKW